MAPSISLISLRENLRFVANEQQRAVGNEPTIQTVTLRTTGGSPDKKLNA
jgi:hypothetical protein